MRNIEIFFLLIIYLLLPLFPVVLFIRAVPNDLSIFLLISRVAGIYAFVWFSLQFIVTARFKPLEWIAGHDRLLMLHMIVAVAALLITAIHTAFGDEESGKAFQAWLGSAGQNVFLYAAIFSALFFSNFFIRFLPFLIPYRNIFSKMTRLTYERCLWLHYAMPAGMILILVHVLLLPGEGFLAFKACMATIVGSGQSFYAWHRFVAPLLLERSPWKVTDVIPESNSVTTLSFESPAGKKLRHHPGQFCYMLPLNNNLPKQAHPFTISSSPLDSCPTITVKSLGDFTSNLKALKPGSLVCLAGAYGRFSYRYVHKDNELVFIAGGIGVTPMLSMLRHLSLEEPNRKVTLIWGAKNVDDLICRDELERISQHMGNLVFEPVLSRSQQWNGRTGRINKSLLTDVFQKRCVPIGNQEVTGVEFFICGPPPLISTVYRALIDLGVCRRCIHTERFAF